MISVLLGDHPHTLALKAEAGPYRFIESKPTNAAFKRVVAEEFDIAELSIVTFLQAKEAGRHLTLLPATLFSRFQHRYLVHDVRRGPLAPTDLPGRRIGCRLYSATTGAWLRGILQADHGIDPDMIEWFAYQAPHVPEAVDPPNVRKAPEGSDLAGLLRDGLVDAIIVDPVPDDPAIAPVIADPEAAGEAWRRRYGAIQINHMVVATEAFSRDQPQALRAFYERLAADRPAGQIDALPFGVRAVRRSLEVAIEMTWRQGMIRTRFAVDDLFDEITSRFL